MILIKVLRLEEKCDWWKVKAHVYARILGTDPSLMLIFSQQIKLSPFITGNISGYTLPNLIRHKTKTA